MPKLMACHNLGKLNWLDTPPRRGQSSRMRARARLGIATALLIAALTRPAGAQAGLASDLWRVAAGTLAVPAALASGGSAALWTPAAVLAGSDPTIRLGVESIHAPTESGVAGTVASAAIRTRQAWTLTTVYGRMALSDLVRTETSPEIVGDIPAYAQVVSFGVARSLADRSVTVGIAVRALTTRLDQRTESHWAADVGCLWERPRFRLGAATHLLDPTSRPGRAAASYSIGTEYRSPELGLGGTPGILKLRYGATLAEGEGVAHLVSGGLALAGVIEVDFGAARESAWGAATWRSRFGAAVTAGRYRVYVGRDGGANGLGATYAFGLAATVR